MKRLICLLAALLISVYLLTGKGIQACRALEYPPAQTTATEPTQPEETLEPMGEEPNFQWDDF